ncbi:MAG: ABC transporter ATP-binding protein, partial [Rikenellaceae bacterium]
KVFEFRDGVVKEHIGGIYDFLQKRNMEILDELNIKNVIENSEVKSNENKLSYLEQKEKEKAVRKAANDLKKTEDSIDKYEKEIAELDKKLAEPLKYGIDINDNSFFEKYEKLKKELDNLLELWEKQSSL